MNNANAFRSACGTPCPAARHLKRGNVQSVGRRYSISARSRRSWFVSGPVGSRSPSLASQLAGRASRPGGERGPRHCSLLECRDPQVETLIFKPLSERTDARAVDRRIMLHKYETAERTHHCRRIFKQRRIQTLLGRPLRRTDRPSCEISESGIISLKVIAQPHRHMTHPTDCSSCTW